MIAIVADIHGNFPALEAVLHDIDARGFERIISLGDVAGYYCMINECISALRDRDILNLMGNHDEYLVTRQGCPRSYSANTCLSFQQNILTESNRQWLARSPICHAEGDISMVHGGWRDPIDEYLYDLPSDYFSSHPYRFFFSGHTHVQVVAKFGAGREEKTYCNPGAVGQPRDGDARAAYATFDGENIILHRVPYDIDKIAFEMKRVGFAEKFYLNLYDGARIGGRISTVKVEGS